MKKFFKTLTGFAFLAVGHRLSREADDLESEARWLNGEASQRRAKSSMLHAMAFNLLGEKYMIRLDFDEEEEEEEEDEGTPPNEPLH